jgi:hypothetical protein
LVVKWNFATNEDIQYHTKTPNIDLWTRVDLGIKQLGCSEVKGTTESGEVAHWVVEVGKSKIDDLDVARLRDKDVLNLEI